MIIFVVVFLSDLLSNVLKCNWGHELVDILSLKITLSSTYVHLNGYGD